MKRYLKVVLILLLIGVLGYHFVIDEFVFVNAVPSDMVLEFDTSKSLGTEIVLPIGTLGEATVCSVNWGDGSSDSYTEAGLMTHTYIEEGIYEVRFTGVFDSFGYGDAEPSNLDACSKLVKVISFGGQDFVSLSGAFLYASNLTEVPNALPATVTNLARMFYGCTAFNGDITLWDTSAVSDMNNMFYDASSFDQDLSSWDFSGIVNATALKDVFYNTDLSVEHYDNLLNNLSATLSLPSNVDFDMGADIKYSMMGNSSHETLVSKSWTITDDGVLTLIIKVSDATKTYLEADPAYSVTYFGFLAGDSELDLGGAKVFSREAGETVNSYTVTVSGLTSSFYKIEYLAGSLVIEKANYDMNAAKWNYTLPFVFNHSEKIVEVTNLPSGVTVGIYVNNKKTDAGNYTASVSLNYDATNYNAPTIANIVWTILKTNYDMSSAAWSYSVPFTYDGSSKFITLVNLPGGVTVSDYFNNEKTNPGEYTASASLNYDSVNYNAPVINNLNWKINAIQASPMGVDGVYPTTALTANGKIINVSTAMEYKAVNANNWISVASEEVIGLSSGIYMVRYKAKEGFVASPAVEVNIIKLSTSIMGEEVVIITEVDDFDLVVELIENGSSLYKDLNKQIKKDSSKAKLFILYDIKLMDLEELAVINSPITIRILIPEELREKKGLGIVNVNGDGVNEISVLRLGNYLEFQTSSLSYYGITTTPVYSFNWILLISIILLLGFSGGATYFGYKQYTSNKGINLKETINESIKETENI